MRTLDLVDWNRLESTGGSAREVPDLIRRLPDEDGAMGALRGLLLDRGSLTPAGVVAVPYLYEVLADPDGRMAVAILDLLVEIAVGHPSVHLPEGFSRGTHLSEDASEEESLRAYRRRREEAYRAAERGLGVAAALLTEGTSPVRSWAAYLLAWFPAAASWVMPVMRDRLSRECVPEVTASCLLAQGMLAGYREVDAESAGIRAFLAPGQPDCVRLAAAIAMYPASRSAIAPEALAVIADAVREDAGTPLSLLPWDGGDLVALAERVLGAVGYPYMKYGRYR